MFLWNYFTNVVCKVPAICGEIDPPLFTVGKSASAFFGVEDKIYKHHTIYRLRNKLNYTIKGTG